MISLLLILFCSVNMWTVGRAMYLDRKSFIHIIEVIKGEHHFRAVCVNTFVVWSLYIVFAIFHLSCVVYLISGFF